MIKIMAAATTKEFMSEMKFLYKVHHTNLVISFVVQNKWHALVLQQIPTAFISLICQGRIGRLHS